MALLYSQDECDLPYLLNKIKIKYDLKTRKSLKSFLISNIAPLALPKMKEC